LGGKRRLGEQNVDPWPMKKEWDERGTWPF